MSWEDDLDNIYSFIGLYSDCNKTDSCLTLKKVKNDIKEFIKQQKEDAILEYDRILNIKRLCKVADLVEDIGHRTVNYMILREQALEKFGIKE